ncbi:hypothetical protein PVL29_002910 [Vitis rotundifolia]|uniref:Uncharacterized protein n=1 Tax=Vitis rotundifolia TaxID=103349 RepID=A0AA39ACL0_VITRO|nr:hypothetical protein PVL29_002910 [Vitis rotundifolia]
MCCLDKEGPSRTGCVQQVRRVRENILWLCSHLPLQPRAAPGAITPSRSLLIHTAHVHVALGFAPCNA